MKTLVVGMQSSGASYVTFHLAQQPHSIAVVDLFCQERVPKFDIHQYDIIVKCTITATIPIKEQIQRFAPDRVVLVTRSIDAIVASLVNKPWRDQAGLLMAKVGVYQNILNRHLNWFDEIISYERFKTTARAVTRSVSDIRSFNEAHSDWCRKHYGTKWGFGALHNEGKAQ